MRKAWKRDGKNTAMFFAHASPAHPLVAHEEEQRYTEARHDDEVDGAPLDDVDKEDAEDDDDEVADEAEAARKVELGSGREVGATEVEYGGGGRASGRRRQKQKPEHRCGPLPYQKEPPRTDRGGHLLVT